MHNHDPSTPLYLHHTIECQPRCWQSVARQLSANACLAPNLYGLWRSQIGTPRDHLNAITLCNGVDTQAIVDQLQSPSDVQSVSATPMRATLRPLTVEPPRRQGNFAFRWFELAKGDYVEFESLCAQAWPGFESAYDSQIIGLWRCEQALGGDATRVLLLTRRPDLAMWERSKTPATEGEQVVRDALSRRYDLCDSTWVYTTTLLTAADRMDEVRWT
jgi:hypothetical protein